MAHRYHTSMPSEKHALVAGELDDPVDLAGGVQVPDERPSRVDLAVSARGVAAGDVDDVVVARLQEEGLGLEADRVEGGEEGQDLVDPALGPDRGWWPGWSTRSPRLGRRRCRRGHWRRTQ
jgi:hypothetical protein